MMLAWLPVVVPVLKKIAPPPVPDWAPWIVQFWMVLLLASAMKRMVLVAATAEPLLLAMVREFPAVFRPLIVTLSAPFRSMSGRPLNVPVMLRAAPPVGW